MLAACGLPPACVWRLRNEAPVEIEKWKLGLHLGIYMLDKWAGPKCYMGQSLGMVWVRVHPRVKVKIRTRILRVHLWVKFEIRTRIHRVWNPRVPVSAGAIAIPSLFLGRAHVSGCNASDLRDPRVRGAMLRTSGIRITGEISMPRILTTCVRSFI